MKVNLKVFNKFVGIMGCMLVLMSLTSCLDDEDGGDPVPVAYVSIFHASPDAPDLDVVLDDQRLFNQPLEYTDYSGYLQFYTGSRQLEFNSYNANNVLADTTYNFQAGKAYSVFVVNEVDELSTLIVEDSTENPDTGKAWVRFIHLSPDAPAVDFAIGEDNTASFTNQQYRQAAQFTEVDAESYAMVLSAAGDDQALVSVPETELKSGSVYTIIARGFVTPPSGNTNALSVQIIRNQ